MVNGLAQSCVAYDGLPISSGGAHALGRIGARDALVRWRQFLDACTDASPIKCWFDFPQTPELTVDPAVVRLIAGKFPGVSHRHLVPRARLDEALSIFESLEPLPTNQWGMAPVWLWFTADFRMLSPRGDVWPGQDPGRFDDFVTPAGVSLGASSSRLILQAKRSLGLTLSIPDAKDDDLGEIVPWLQSALPMRLSPKHWTRWTLTKAGNSYRGKRIDPMGSNNR